jgi:hypothetical protein
MKGEGRTSILEKKRTTLSSYTPFRGMFHSSTDHLKTFPSSVFLISPKPALTRVLTESHFLATSAC